MKIRPYPKVCAYCTKDFLGDKINSKYCSSICRYAWQQRHLSEKAKIRRKEYQKKWGLDNWLRRRNYMIKLTFGITSEQYQELLERQNYSCAICGRHETEFSKKLAVDHDHKTNEIFGLLCTLCNQRIVGKIRNPDLFLKAAEYLKQGTGWFVPPKRKKRRCRKKIKKPS